MDSYEQARWCVRKRQGGTIMRYILQKLNVVKTVERADQRDALLAKGFVEVVEKKLPTKSSSKQAEKADGEAT